MSDVPRLMVPYRSGSCSNELCSCHDIEYVPATVSEASAWLRERKAGEEVGWCAVHGCQSLSSLNTVCWYHHFMSETTRAARTSCRIVSSIVVPSDGDA